MFDDEISNQCCEVNNPIFAKNYVYVENQKFVVVVGTKKILRFSKSQIELLVSKNKMIKILGENLEVLELQKDQTKIVGHVFSVVFEGEK